MTPNMKKLVKKSGADKLLPYGQERFSTALKAHGFSEESLIFELMSSFGGEFHGKDGFITNLAEDLLKGAYSLTNIMREEHGLKNDLFVLTNGELDYFIIYDKVNDSVYLFESPEYPQFIAGSIQPRWLSFEEFFNWFFS